MTFGRRWLVAVATTAVLVSGCADEPEPEFAPPSESPTSASPSPSDAPTRAPWEKKTTAGAVAFAKHWIDVFNEAQKTGDTSAMRELSLATCRSCEGFAEQLDGLYAHGGHLDSEGWRIVHSVPTQGHPQGKATVDLRIRRSPQVVHRGDGAKRQRFPGGLATFSATLVWSKAGWRMRELELLT